MVAEGAAADLARLGHEAGSAPDNESAALTHKVLTQKTDAMLKGMVKRYITMAESEKSGDTEAAEASKAAFAKDLHLFEFEMGKARRMENAKLRELELYAKVRGSLVVCNQSLVPRTSRHTTRLMVI